jgi:hypothetical protein
MQHHAGNPAFLQLYYVRKRPKASAAPAGGRAKTKGAYDQATVIGLGARGLNATGFHPFRICRSRNSVYRPRAWGGWGRQNLFAAIQSLLPRMLRVHLGQLRLPVQSELYEVVQSAVR